MEKAKKFNYAIKYTSEYHPEWVRRDKRMKKAGVDLRKMARYDDETKTAVRKWGSVHKDIRKIDNKGVAIGISEHDVVIALIKNNTILAIKDKAFIGVMKDLFLAKWKVAEKV